MKKTVCFDDVLLVPQFSAIESRSEIDISSELGPNTLTLGVPIISSPMDTVTEQHMAHAMEGIGGLGVIHRYNSVEQQVMIVKKAHDIGTVHVAAAIGVGSAHLERAAALYDVGVRILCVDIAHGHHILMKKMLYDLREIFRDAVHIMAGNVATLAAFNDLADWGADSIRVGIGGGSICSTRTQTGHGMPTLESIISCASSDRSAKLIADGGLRTSGDIVKALAAGADFVMLGSMLAGHAETPGGAIFINGQKRKVYRGMASKDAQIEWRGRTSSVEGVSSTVSYRGGVAEKLHEIKTGIRSGLSYTGARNLCEFRSRALFIEQSSSGATEGLTHINL